MFVNCLPRFEVLSSWLNSQVLGIHINQVIGEDGAKWSDSSCQSCSWLVQALFLLVAKLEVWVISSTRMSAKHWP